MTNSRISALKCTYACPTPEVVVVAFIINTGTVKQCYMLPLVCGDMHMYRTWGISH